MDRLDIAIALLEEAKEEKKNLELYNKEYEKLPSYKEPGYRVALDNFFEKFPRIPKKSVINDNIKMARRILAGEYM